jgi:hypothetical protein
MKKAILSIIIFIFTIMCTALVSAGVFINEFLADPSGSEPASEWIEVYYNGSGSVDLQGWYFNDSSSRGNNLSGILSPANRHIVFNGTQTGIQLNNAGDEIYLHNSSGDLIDSISYADAQQDISTGRKHDGLSEWVNFSSPTPDAPNNRLPYGDVGNQTLAEDSTSHFAITDYISDDDNDMLAFSIVGENVNEVDCNITNETNVTLTPAPDWNGIANCTIKADDGYGAVEKLFYINVSAVNDAPVLDLSPLNGMILDEDSYNDTLNLSAYVSDVDNAAAEINWSCSSNSTDVIAAADNTTKMLNLSATNNFYGSVNVTCAAYDADYAAVDYFQVEVAAVNDAPTISAAIPDIAISEEGYNDTLNLSNYFNDVDSDLSYSADSLGSGVNAVVYGGSMLNVSAIGDFFGNVSINVTASDGEYAANQTLAVIVSNVNDAPSIDPSISPISFLEGEYQIVNLSDYVDDVDNENWEINWSSAHSQNLSVDIKNDTKIMNVSALPTWYGKESFTLTANDGNLIDSKEVEVNVQSILSFSDLVVTIDGNDYSATDGAVVGPASPDSTLSLSVRVNNNYPAAEQWVEAITITGRVDSTIDDVTSTSLPFSLNGSKSATKELAFNNMPLTIYEGYYELNITANGTDYKGVSREVSWVVYINYTTENNEVRILDANLTHNSLSCYRVTNLNVSLVNTGETLQYANVTISNTDLGIYESRIVPLSAKQINGTIYTIELPHAPTPQTYPINIELRYDDGAGGYITEEAVVELAIETCFDVEDQSIDEDSLSGIVIDLYDYVDDAVKNDSDFAYNIENETNTELISCSISSNRYINCSAPAPNQTGYSDINVSVVNDSSANYDTFRIVVEEVNDAPVAYDASAAGDEDTAININLNCTDIDSISLNYIVVDEPSHGEVSGNGSSMSYMPEEDYYGTDSFTYKCNDGQLDSNTAVVNITINSIIDEPSIAEVSPDYNPKIGDGVNQDFSITLDDPDGINPVIRWYVDDNLKQTGSTSFSWSSSSDFVVKVNITNSTQGYEHVWEVTVSDEPITNNYDFSYAQTLENATNVTISSQYGEIYFGNQTLNLSDVVDIDRFVRIEEGVVGIDSANLPALDAPATIRMFNLQFQEMPPLYYNSGFSISGTDTCPSNVCSNIRYNASTGTLEFDVAGFSIYWVPVSNHAPVITTSPITKAYIGELYEYDVDATDEDNDTLTYSLTAAPAGMTIDAATGLISWTPTNATTEGVTVKVEDGRGGIDTQSFTITSKEREKLAIKSLDVKVDGKSDKGVEEGNTIKREAKPESDIEFKIEVENTFTDEEDLDIDDIIVEVSIRDIDDGDDLEEESNEFNLRAGKDKKVTLDFKIPLEVDEGTYDVDIHIEGEDENGTLHEIDWTVFLNVEKDKHDVRIIKATLNPSVVKCDNTATLDTEIINLGRDMEDEVVLEVTSPELGVGFVKEGIELDEGTEDNTYSRSITINVPDELGIGIYPITINSYYDTAHLSDSETINLEVQECKTLKKEKEEVKAEPVEVIIAEEEPKAEPKEAKKIKFTDTEEYLVLLIILFVILTGLVIFSAGAAVMLIKKK